MSIDRELYKCIRLINVLPDEMVEDISDECMSRNEMCRKLVDGVLIRAGLGSDIQEDVYDIVLAVSSAGDILEGKRHVCALQTNKEVVDLPHDRHELVLEKFMLHHYRLGQNCGLWCNGDRFDEPLSDPVPGVHHVLPSKKRKLDGEERNFDCEPGGTMLCMQLDVILDVSIGVVMEFVVKDLLNAGFSKDFGALMNDEDSKFSVGLPGNTDSEMHFDAFVGVEG